MDSKLINFANIQCDIKSLVNTIALQGKDLVGVELGIYRAESFCTLLQCVPNIKKLYGVALRFISSYSLAMCEKKAEKLDKKII